MGQALLFPLQDKFQYHTPHHYCPTDNILLMYRQKDGQLEG